MTCGIVPPNFEPILAEGSPCDLPAGNHTEHRTTLPNGDVYVWDGFMCAYPDDCTYDGDADCCVSFGKVALSESRA